LEEEGRLILGAKPEEGRDRSERIGRELPHHRDEGPSFRSLLELFPGSRHLSATEACRTLSRPPQWTRRLGLPRGRAHEPPLMPRKQSCKKKLPAMREGTAPRAGSLNRHTPSANARHRDPRAFRGSRSSKVEELGGKAGSWDARQEPRSSRV